MIFNFFAIAVLIAISAVLSGMETAITAATLNKIKLAKLRGVKNSDKALELFPIKEKIISVLVIADNIVSTLATTLSTSIAIQICGQDMGLIASSIITPILVTAFGEILPKIIAVVKAESILINSSPLFQFLLILFSPLSNTLDQITNKVRRYIKPNPLYELHQEENYPESYVPNGSKEGTINTFNIENLPVTSIMSALEVMQRVNMDLPAEKFLEEALSIPYTKIPVWQFSPDNIIGVLQVQLLLRSLAKIQGSKGKKLKEIIDHAVIPLKMVQQNTNIASQLIHFTKHQYGFAIVVNEDSTHLGFLTLNDIISSIASSTDTPEVTNS